MFGWAPASAAFALGRIGANAEVVVPALVATLQHKRWEVRAAAASALGKFGDQAKVAVPALIERLKHDDSLVLEPVAKTLKRMGPQSVATATSALIEALKNKSEEVRRTAAYSLALVDVEGKSVPALIRVLRERGSVRYTAAWALGTMGPKAKSAVPALMEALKDKDKGLHAIAAEALEKINPGTGAKAGER